jgi:hypothetical protein
LDDLIGVNQLGQARVFAFDSLNVETVMGAINPENMTMGVYPRESCAGGAYALCYSYDNDGNLLNKTNNLRPCDDLPV